MFFTPPAWTQQIKNGLSISAELGLVALLNVKGISDGVLLSACAASVKQTDRSAAHYKMDWDTKRGTETAVQAELTLLLHTYVH